MYTDTPVVVCCHNNESADFFGSIFYKRSVVGNNTYSTHTKMGGGTHSARRYRRDCEVIIMFEYIYAVRSGDQFFYPSSRNFNFVAR